TSGDLEFWIIKSWTTILPGGNDGIGVPYPGLDTCYPCLNMRSYRCRYFSADGHLAMELVRDGGYAALIRRGRDSRGDSWRNRWRDRWRHCWRWCGCNCHNRAWACCGEIQPCHLTLIKIRGLL